jgi:aspartokinase/homoserine dehydrogenase 1
LAEANAKDSRLKFVAQFEDGKASVICNSSQKTIRFTLRRKRHIVLFYTDRYVVPTFIDGAGGGERQALVFLLM